MSFADRRVHALTRPDIAGIETTHIPHTCAHARYRRREGEAARREAELGVVHSKVTTVRAVQPSIFAVCTLSGALWDYPPAY